MIELLVALSIMSIVAVVIYQGFIMTARTNSKAKLQHKATSVAQNVIEGLKAQTIDEILYQFCYPEYTNLEGNRVTNFKILPVEMLQNSISTSVAAGANYMVGTAMEPQKGYQRTADGKYSFTISGVKMENTLFDVRITLDSSPYTTGAVSNSGQNYNSQEMIHVPTMDSNYDAVIANTKEYDLVGWSAVETSVGAGYPKAQARREIEVLIEDAALISGDTASKVTVTYKYFYGADPIPKYEETDVVFDNSLNPEYPLRNLFLFFRPSYDYAPDEIVINNPDDKEMNLFLVKQKYIEDGTLMTKENSYKAKITVKGSAAATAESMLKINTNLGTNMWNGGSVASQVDYSYYAGSIEQLNRTPESYLGVNNLTNSYEEDKLMDVTVEVYQGAEKAASITSTIRN